MHPDVKKLLDLQAVDQKIAHARKDLDSLPKEEEKRRVGLTKLESKFHSTKAELHEGELQDRNNDALISQADAEIKKLLERLNGVKNNAEYQAILLQIESVKRERGVVEETGLCLIDQLEGLRAELGAAEDALAKERAIFDEFLEKAAKLRAVREREVTAVSTGREDLVAALAPDCLDKYSRLFGARGNLAVCAVDGETCTGCYLTVPPNLLVKIRAGSSLVHCSSCRRILYAES